MKSTRTASFIVTAALLLPSLSACGGSASAESTPAASAPAASAPDTTSTSAASSAAAPADLSASLTWPKGTDTFTVNVCASQGPNTIQGGGSSEAWNLQFDANLLQPGDEGTLVVGSTSDMAVAYDAKITSLTVNSDGTFTGEGQDAGSAPFTITGTCDVSW